MKPIALPALLGAVSMFAPLALAGSPPKVVRTVPAADAKDVDPGLTVMTIPFDQPMKTDSWSLVKMDNYPKGNSGRVMKRTELDLQIKTSDGQVFPIRSKSGINCTEEVLSVDDGKPVEVRKRISEFILIGNDPETGEVTAAPRLDGPLAVRIDLRRDPQGQPDIETLEGRLPSELHEFLSEETFLDLLPRRPVRVGELYDLPAETLTLIKDAFDPKGTGKIDLKLRCRRIGPRDVPDARNEMVRAQGGGTPVTYIFDVAEFDIEWQQDGTMENNMPFTLAATGQVVFAIQAGVLLKIGVDGKVKIKPVKLGEEYGEPLTVSGEGTYKTDYSFEPIGWTRGVKSAKGAADAPSKAAQPGPQGERPAPSAPDQQAPPRSSAEQPSRSAPPRVDGRSSEQARDTVDLPSGWVVMDDPVIGSRVGVPPGWTPRVRGDVALCVEPDDPARASAFFVPMRFKGATSPESLADGFDEMLRRGLPTLRTQTTGRPTGESVQRDLSASISGVAVTGGYRAVVGKWGTGFIMGYLAPADRVDELRPAFYRILGSYRFTGPRMRLQPFKSAAIELRVPPGWTVRTSEMSGTADQDIDWEVLCPQVSGARALMVSPKFFTPNWISDAFTGQVDPQALALWQNRGYEMASAASDDQIVRMALEAALPGLEVVRRQSLDEVRDVYAKLFETAARTIEYIGGRFTISVYEIIGRRMVQGVEMRCVVYLGMSSLLTDGGIKGTLGLWNTGLSGFEAPAGEFRRLAPTLDRVAGSFTYTTWWLQTVMKANEEQARTIRKLQEDVNRIDREIWDNRVQTQSAITEMMYDTLTENYGYVNEKTGSIEKIPVEQLERFRKENGDIASPEDVIDRRLPLHDATPVREASADDYMAFDRRVQVWP